jgi:hypothetical protein
MTLVDQQEMFNDTVNAFVHGKKPTTTIATRKVDYSGTMDGARKCDAAGKQHQPPPPKRQAAATEP